MANHFEQKKCVTCRRALENKEVSNDNKCKTQFYLKKEVHTHTHA